MIKLSKETPSGRKKTLSPVNELLFTRLVWAPTILVHTYDTPPWSELGLLGNNNEWTELES